MFNEVQSIVGKIVLYHKKEECSGCGACFNVCPKQAIEMKSDEYGIVYPIINNDLCTCCGFCKDACNFQSENVGNKVLEVFAAVSKDVNLIKKSASGGVFATIAQEVLSEGGMVYGCSLESVKEKQRAVHIRIECQEELWKLQGSKYMQSDTNDVFKQVEQDLKDERTVLFSGTPCQVAGLYGSLGNKPYHQLLTADLICHGVPSNQWFQSYLEVLEKRLKGEITNFIFRDKSKGWGKNARLEYRDSKKHVKKKNIPAMLSSYYHLFLKSEICRDSCYRCKYASETRSGDLSLGDYWGIQKEHPEYLVSQGGEMDDKTGISCLLVNTQQGYNILQKYGTKLVRLPSTFENVAKYNTQLVKACIKTEEREKIMELYRVQGYQAVERYFSKRLGKKRYIYLLKSMIPIQLKMLMKRYSSKYNLPV